MRIKNWEKTRDEPYSVLYVNTIEGRVNHPYVLIRKQTMFEAKGKSRKWMIYLGENKKPYRILPNKAEALKAAIEWMRKHPRG